MSDLGDFIDRELYPALFDYIDTAFPEHNFKRFPGGWRSNTYLNGTTDKSREDKTVVTKNYPGRILEQGGDNITLVQYVMRRDNLDAYHAAEKLARIVSLKPPRNDDFDREAYRRKTEREDIMEALNSYFIYCLENEKDNKHLNYLTSHRGYSPGEATAMELGRALEVEKIEAYLKETKKYPADAVDEVMKSLQPGRVGKTHTLTIPYRVGGKIKGFKFRTLGDVKPKYINTTGLDKSGGFFNIPGYRDGRDLIITEGELDTLHASSKGVKNVVSTGGDSVSPEQVKDAIKRGYENFIICFDAEPGKKENTVKKINKVIKVITDEGVNSVYVAELPSDEVKVDVDSYIATQGVDAFRKVINEAKPYYQYQLDEIIDRYGDLQDSQGGELYPKDVDALQEDVITTGEAIKNPLHKDRYKKLFLDEKPIQGLGITEESLGIVMDRLTSSREREEQKKELNKVLEEARQLQEKGDTSQALEVMERKLKDVRLRDKTAEFEGLLIPNSEEGIMERMAVKPENLETSYTIGGETIYLPSGALTFLSAPTSHGKTTLLLNLALDVAKRYKDKNFYFFSYEEDRDAITSSALNIYQGRDISTNNRRSISDYFKTGSTEYVKTNERDTFMAAKDRFFNELIDTNRLNIQYSNYNSELLADAIRYLARNGNAGGVFIDYMQLLNLPEGKYKTYSRQEEIKQICIALKDVAVETGLPLVLGAQFNRKVLNHLLLHPTNIGEAGDIERVANLIIGFWNNNFKVQASEGEADEINRRNIRQPNTIYAEVLKNRGGRMGLSDLWAFNGNTGNIGSSVNIVNGEAREQVEF